MMIDTGSPGARAAWRPEVAAAFAAGREGHPEMAAMLDFYEAVFEMPLPPGAVRSVPAGEVAARLDAGQPAMTAETLALDGPTLAELARQLIAVIRAYRPDWPGARPPAPARCLRIAGDWLATGDPPVSSQAEIDTATLAVRLATAACLREGRARLEPVVTGHDWGRPVCPYCGGRPALAVLAREDGSRRLFCPRCHGLWAYRRTACPSCDAPASRFFQGASKEQRLYVCDRCRRYLKTIDLRETSREPVWPVEHVLTVAMDLAAQQAGYLPP